MRPDLSAADKALIASGESDLHYYLSVANGSGTQIDLSDRLLSVSHTEPSPNEPIGSLTVELHRELWENGESGTASTSLAPLIEASELNRLDDGTTYSRLLQGGRLVVLGEAYTAVGASKPASSSYEVFRGRIRSADSGGMDSPASFYAMDQAADLSDRWALTQTTYASGTLIQDAIQSVLTDNSTGVTLNVPTSSAATLSAGFEPDIQSVWSIILLLAQEIGWLLMYQYQADGTAALTFFEPHRSKTSPDYTFVSAQVEDVQALNINVEDVRNEAHGQAVDADGAIVTYTASDSGSIAEYGGIPRGFRIALDETSPVRTLAGLTSLIDAAISDRRDPDATHEARAKHFPGGQCGVDLYRFPANHLYHDTAEDRAPFAIRHDWVQGERPVTMLSVRGKPSAGNAPWEGLVRRYTEPDSVYGITKVRVSYAADGTTATVTAECGSKVESVSLYQQDVQAGTPEDENPFEDGSFIELKAVSVGEVSFTISRPSRHTDRFIGLLPLDEDLENKAPGVIRIIRPVEATLGENVFEFSRTNGSAVVHANATDAPTSSFPISVSLYRTDPDSVAIGTGTLATSADHVAVTISDLPRREPVKILGKFTDVAGNVEWDDVTLHRDPLPWGAASLRDFQDAPVILTRYDSDTDSVIITTPSGVLTVDTSGNTGGEHTYVVGTTALDDLSTESLLKTDEVRTGYKVEITGGGETLVIWGNGSTEGVLHGEAAQPPTLKPRLELSSNRDTADVYLRLRSPVAEDVGCVVVIGEGATDPEYTLCTSGGATLYAASGTEVGPSNWFKTAAGSPVNLLNDVALTANQIKRWVAWAVGEDSGVEGQDVSIALSAKEKPELAAATTSYDRASGEITATVTGGPFMGTSGATGSVSVIADEAGNNFASPLSALTANVYTGDTQSVVFTVPSSQRGLEWECQATPYNGPLSAGTPTGLAGDPTVFRTVTEKRPLDVQVKASQTGSTGTVTLTLDDSDSRLDSVRFKTKSGPGAFDWSDPTDGTWTTDSTAPYSVSVTLHEEHGGNVAWAVGYTNDSASVVYRTGHVHMDPDLIAKILGFSASLDTSSQLVGHYRVDEDTTRVYWTSGNSTTPADPTTTDSHVVVSGITGEIATGTGISAGGVGVIKMRPWNSTNGLGDTVTAKAKAAPDAGEPINVQVKGSQSGTTGTLTLSITDPEARLNRVLFKTKSGTGAFDWSDPTDGTWTEDTIAPYSTTVTLSGKGGGQIAYAVGYLDDSSTELFVSDSVAFDPDTVAKITAASASLSDAFELLGDYTVDEDASVIYWTAGDGTTPADPTTLSSSVTVTTLSGSISTGTTVSEGNNGVIKFRPWNATSGLGDTVTRKVLRIAAGDSNPVVASARAVLSDEANSCGTSDYLKNSLTITFSHADGDYEYWVYRLVDGVRETTVTSGATLSSASPSAITDTQSPYIWDISGTNVQVSYEVQIFLSSDSSLKDGGMSNNLSQYRTSC